MKLRDRIIASVLACSLVVGNSFFADASPVLAEEHSEAGIVEVVEQDDDTVGLEQGYHPSFESDEGQNWFFSNSCEDFSFNGEFNITQLDQYAIDMNAPDIQDGCLMATFKASELYNLTPIVRYKDADNLVAMGFGGNNVLWCSRNEGSEGYGTKDFEYDYSNKDYVTVKIKFEGKKLSLFLDGYKAWECENATYLGAGKCGFRTWNGKKDITVKDIYYSDCTADLYTGMDELYALTDSCAAYDEASYTSESYAIFRDAYVHAKEALAEAELQVTNVAEIQTALDQAYAGLEKGIAALEEKPEERINVTENYDKDEANWTGEPVREQGMLHFEIPAGAVVRNLNEKAQIEAGAYTYEIKTDANGRFGVAFNCADDDTFCAVYNDREGGYLLRDRDGKEITLSENSLRLLPETEYNICIVSNPYGVTVYVNNALAGKAEVEGICENRGGIGLFNPSEQTMKLELKECSVYETYYYFNDYSDAENIGTWKTKNTTISHTAEGTLNGDGELKLETAPVSFAFATDTPRIRNGIYEFDLANHVPENAGRIVFLFRGVDSESFAGLFYNVSGKWRMYTKEAGNAESDTEFNGTALFTENEKHHFRFEVQEQSVILYMDGKLVGRGEYNLPNKAGFFGIRKNYESGDIRLDNLKITETYTIPEPDREEKPVSIESASMQVRMDEAFPRVLDYTLNSKTLPGNTKKVYGIKINSELYYPLVSCEKKDASTLVYTLQIPDIDVSMKIQYQVADNQLKMNILNIEEKGSVEAETISFVDDVLFSTDPEDKAASMGTVYADNTWTSVKETLYPTLEDAAEGESYQTYVTLASNGLAATVNNSALETGRRMRVEFVREEDTVIGKAGNGLLDYHRPDTEEPELPWATVLICEDYNQDGDVNWQDAAASYKKIRDKVFGDDQMKNNMMWIAYNSGSQVQEPFYKSLDMVRQFYNFTDGFGQMVMHKGYQAEGHDDSHGDYGGHIGTRQGGKDAFNNIIELGKNYHAKFGIHINVNEHMLDALHLNQDSLEMPLAANWGHWDQAYLLDQSYDILSGNRDKSLDALKEELPDLNFVYVDIYGVDSPAGWMSNNLESALNKRGYIVGTEFSGPMEQGAAFTHWGNDIHYPNQGNNSVMMRYFKNDTDIFMATALTLGNRIPGVATWGDTNIREGVETFYNHILLTKYLQHLDVLDYEPGQYAAFSEGVRTEFTPEGDKVILTCDGRKMAEWEYLGVDSNGGELTGDAKLLLPWFEGEDGEPNQADKLYHWNAGGGVSTWEVPEKWADYAGADVYRLTGDDKEYVRTVEITDKKVTLEAEQGIGYVLYPAGHAAPDVADDFGEGSPLKNPGFDTADLSMWNVETENEADAQVTMDDEYETMLTMEGEADASVSVSQVMEGLKPGKTYTVYLFADVKDNASLRMDVQAGEKNYVTKAEKSFITYYGITKYTGTTFQKVKVTFDMPEDESLAVLTLKGIFNGSSSITLDDVRVWENETRSPQLDDEGMEEYVVYEDFENVEQGFGPFIGAGGQGTGWDHRVHLAETREDAAQYLDYVADGHYSLKITQDGNGNLIRTNPNTVKLEAKKEYELGLEYITGVNGRYQMTVRNGAGDVVMTYDFEATPLSENSHSLSSRKITKIFRTGDSDDYYVSIDTIDNDAEAVPEEPEMGSKLERTFLSLDNFYIKGTDERVTITFVVDGEETKVVTQKGETPDIEEPVKEGYRFLGWFTAPDGGIQVTEFNESQTVYAQFEREPDTSENSRRILLAIVYKAYAQLDTSVYTKESAEALAEALEAAARVMEQENADGEAVEKAAEDIMKAAAGLIVDTADLEAAVKAAKEAAEAANLVAQQAKTEAAKAEAAQKAAEEARKRAEAAEKAALDAKARFEEMQKQMQQAGERFKDGQICNRGAYSYQIISAAKKTVKVVGVRNTKLKKIKVYNTIKLGGKTYKVVSVGASAFANSRSAASAVIGKNVKIIGNKAFAGCRKLKNITIKSKSLKQVGRKAFKGISKKAVIRVPSGKYRAYTSLLAKRGQSKGVKIKK